MNRLPFPMPNDQIDGRTVVASAVYDDDEHGELIALVLLLEQEAPFFTVAHYALTDIPPDFASVEMARGEIDVLGRFSNIVPAIAEYTESGGDY